MRALWTSLVLIALCAGCGKDADPAPTPPAPGPAEPAPAVDPLPPPPTEPTEEELPVAEDFEKEVSAEITDENYTAELDAIEKELEQE